MTQNTIVSDNTSLSLIGILAFVFGVGFAFVGLYQGNTPVACGGFVLALVAGIIAMEKS